MPYQAAEVGITLRKVRKTACSIHMVLMRQMVCIQGKQVDKIGSVFLQDCKLGHCAGRSGALASRQRQYSTDAGNNTVT
jgi:hypothetical protein